MSENHYACEDDWIERGNFNGRRTRCSRIRSEQDKGAYAVVIRGVEGVYFIQTLEYDDLGPYETLTDAEEAVDQNFGEFLI